jgi:EmrB/QacA subfamily drug resistance transporter
LDQQQTDNYYKNNSAARLAALVIVCIGSFLAPLALSSVNIAAPAIAKALQADAIYVSWIPTSLLLANVVTLLPVGRLADIWGRKRMYLTGSILFALASMVGAFANKIEWLLLFRIFQGVALSMIFSCSMAIITSIYKSGQRGTVLGIVAAFVYLGLTCGPLIGGWLTQYFGWRAVFLFPIPLSLLSIVLLLWKLRGEWRGPPGQRLDWMGSILFGVGIAAVFLGISNLPSLEATVTLAIAVTMLGLFVYQQNRAPFPLVRLKSMWGNRMFSYSLLASILMYAASYPLVFLLSLYLQYLQGMSSTSAGQLMVLQAVVMVFVAPVSGRLSDRLPAATIASAGCVFAACGYLILQWIDYDSSAYLIGCALLVLGLGFGLFSTPNNNAALGAVHEDKMGIATALLSLSRVLGNMLGTAVVVLLVTLYIGEAKIEPEQYPALLIVIKISMGCSLCFALLAACFSFSRGTTQSN